MVVYCVEKQTKAMNIVKLVILFCDHCVLLCNMCKMFGTPTPTPLLLLCQAGSPWMLWFWSSCSERFSLVHSVPPPGSHTAPLVLSVKDTERASMEALWMFCCWTAGTEPVRSGSARLGTNRRCRSDACLKTDVLINKVPSVSTGIKCHRSIRSNDYWLILWLVWGSELQRGSGLQTGSCRFLAPDLPHLASKVQRVNQWVTEPVSQWTTESLSC